MKGKEFRKTAAKFFDDLKWIARNLIVLINTNFILKTYLKT